MVNLDDYKRKIDTILSNRLGLGDNEPSIRSVHIWLECEWQCTEMEMSEKTLLDNYIDVCASEIISMF